MAQLTWNELKDNLRQKFPTVVITAEQLSECLQELDAVPVVRCKDCKKYIPCQKLPIGTSKWCDLFDRATCEMNYCGWGERREDAETN